jgi:hypothetical protein
MNNQLPNQPRISSLFALIVLFCVYRGADTLRNGLSITSKFGRSIDKRRYIVLTRFTEIYLGDDDGSLITTPRRRRQVRKQPIDRRPRYYWSESTNLRNELCRFWSRLGVDTNNTSPTIPNESLLVYCGRHDIRAAIVKNGGRQSLSLLLNNASIMPGRWKDAVATNVELQHLLHIDSKLSAERPPWMISNTGYIQSGHGQLWSHHEGRNEKGHWNLQKVIQELYVCFTSGQDLLFRKLHI